MCQKNIPSVNDVTDVPKGFSDWIADNAGRIDAAESGKGSLPYFIRDNRETVDFVLRGKPTGKAVSAAENGTIPTESAVSDTQKAVSDEVLKERQNTADAIVPPHIEDYIPYNDGKFMVSPLHGEDELESNLKLAQTMYDIFGETVYLLPNINPNGANAHLRAEYIPKGVKEGKNADFLCANRIWDGKGASFQKSDRSRKSIKSIIENHIKKAKQQADNMIIEIPDWVKEEWIDQTVINHLNLTSVDRWIIIKRENGKWKLYKK